jgi:hypothetical protein
VVVVVALLTTETARYRPVAASAAAVARPKHTADLDIPVHITEMVWAAALLLIQELVEINIIMAGMAVITQVVVVVVPTVMQVQAGLESS